jgi:predicted secreted protein
MKCISTLVILVAIIGLASAKHFYLDLNNQTISEQVDNKAVSLKVGDNVTIQVSENPTTGY